MNDVKSYLQGLKMKIEVIDEPLGTNRYDKGVYVIFNGCKRKIGTLRLGLNKKGIVLENGMYVCLEEFLAHLKNESLKESLVQEVKKSCKLLIQEGTDKIKNQLTKRISIKGKNEFDFIKKGLFMLGNKGIVLSNGEYVLERDLEDAWLNYLNTTNDNKVENVKNLNKKWNVIPAALLAMVFLSLGGGISKVDADTFDDNYSLDYEFNVLDDVLVSETVSNDSNFSFTDLKIGDEVSVSSGIIYYESSDYKYGGASKSGMVLEDTTYEIDHFSFLYNGEILEVVSEEETSFSDVLGELFSDYNLTYQDVECMANLSNPDAGWVFVHDLENSVSNVQEVVHTKKVVTETLVGTEQNFKGKITLPNSDSEVFLGVMDENNKLFKGSIVLGNDGREYQISKLSLRKQKSFKESSSWSFDWKLQNIAAKKRTLVNSLNSLKVALQEKTRDFSRARTLR